MYTIIIIINKIYLGENVSKIKMQIEYVLQIIKLF